MGTGRPHGRRLRPILDATPPGLALWQAVHRGVVGSDEFLDQAQLSHRARMALILGTPELQAHSVLRYAEWRGVIASWVAERRGLDPTDLLPVTVGHVSLALALAAYETWLRDPSRPLAGLVDEAMLGLRDHLDVSGG